MSGLTEGDKTLLIAVGWYLGMWAVAIALSLVLRVLLGWWS